MATKAKSLMFPCNQGGPTKKRFSQCNERFCPQENGEFSDMLQFKESGVLLQEVRKIKTSLLSSLSSVSVVGVGVYHKEYYTYILRVYNRTY